MTFFNKEFLKDLFEILELILELMNNPRYAKQYDSMDNLFIEGIRGIKENWEENEWGNKIKNLLTEYEELNTKWEKQESLSEMKKKFEETMEKKK